MDTFVDYLCQLKVAKSCQRLSLAQLCFYCIQILLEMAKYSYKDNKNNYCRISLGNRSPSMAKLSSSFLQPSIDIKCYVGE